jgi:diketogulonate reductase-like aldo/keto reductase
MIVNGKDLHPIGIGTWGMGGARFDDGTLYADYDHDQEAVDAIRYSLSRGQNHIDTAQLYGAGHTEEIVGQAIRGLDRGELFIASKVAPSHALRSAVPRAAEGMLRRLGIDRLDLLYIHAPWEAVPMQEYVDGVNDALEAGLTDTIGVSNFGLEQLERFVSMSRNPLVANQVHYNLLDRRYVTDAFRRYCQKNGIAIVAYRPVERRLLADRCENQEVLRVAEKHSRTPAQVAINWLVSQEGVVTIPKAVSHGHIDENLGSVDFQLDESDRQTLDRLG